MGTLHAVVDGIRFFRAVPALVLISRSRQRGVIEHDVDRWVQCISGGHDHESKSRQIAWLLAKFPEFRNLLHYRLKTGSRLHGKAAEVLYKGESTLRLEAKFIGPGLFIQHGFSTIVAAESIGTDCWINQQVTIGHVYDRGAPKIGDNVTIAAGSQVVGPVSIGDGATIGAGTTVTKDVPAGAKAVGASFRLLPATN